MIIPDVNLLVYAYSADAPHHKAARAWWERLMNGQEEVGLPWVVLCGFIRLMTDARVLVHPLNASTALDIVQTWLARPHVSIPCPDKSHTKRMRELFQQAGVAGRLTTDVHIAAMAMDLGADLHSNDRDFARFTQLKWINPLA